MCIYWIGRLKTYRYNEVSKTGVQETSSQPSTPYRFKVRTTSSFLWARWLLKVVYSHFCIECDSTTFHYLSIAKWRRVLLLPRLQQRSRFTAKHGIG